MGYQHIRLSTNIYQPCEYGIFLMGYMQHLHSHTWDLENICSKPGINTGYHHVSTISEHASTSSTNMGYEPTCINQVKLVLIWDINNNNIYQPTLHRGYSPTIFYMFVGFSPGFDIYCPWSSITILSDKKI